MESCVVCKNMYKRGRGLKIHQTKSGCSRLIPHRRSKSEATGTQDSNHSDAGGRVELGTTPFAGVPSRGINRSNQQIKTLNSSTIKQVKERRHQETVLDVHINNDLYEDIQELLTEKRKKKPEKTTDIRNWFKSTQPATRKIDNLQITKSATSTDQMYTENVRTIELSEDNVDRPGTEIVDLTDCIIKEAKQNHETHGADEGNRRVEG